MVLVIASAGVVVDNVVVLVIASAGVVVDNVVVVVIELDMVVKFIVIVALVAGSVNSTVVSEIFELISQY